MLAERKDSQSKMVLYTNTGCKMLYYSVDLTEGTLVPRGSVTLPSIVQYAWPHTSRHYLYVACSSQKTQPENPRHCLATLRIDPLTGQLTPHGEPVPLPARPIHLTSDMPSEHVLVAFSVPSGVQVFRINPDFTIGVEVSQLDVLDYGVFAHQIRITPDNRHAILVTRGVSATKRSIEKPGALKIFRYHQGVLSPETSIAPDGGFGFGPRHLDFHPAKPWVYVSLERQNKLYTYKVQDGILAADPAFRNETLARPERKRTRQMAGAIHIHPNGRFVYVANRADGVVYLDGGRYFAGGENNIAVYEIDQCTGEPKLIQHADTRKVYPRTFDIDPSGRLMVVQNTVPVALHDGSAVPAGITSFRIGEDGRLSRVSEIDLGGDKETMQWLGLLALPKLNAEASICQP